MAELTANIRKTAGKAMMPLAGDLVLLKAGEAMQDELGGIYYGPSTEHPCKGWIANYSDLSKLAAARPISSRKVVILAHTLDVTPDITDQVVIGGETWYVGDVGTDQSGAAWELQVGR